MNESGAPALPMPVLLASTVVLLLLMLRAYRDEQTVSGRFLIVVIWLRIIMQALHPYTYQTVGGLSLNAIASLGVCAVGLWLFLPSMALLSRLWSAVVVCMVIAISGVLNGLIVPTIETILKWGYFFFIFLALVRAIDQAGNAGILRRLIWALLPALVFQVLSIGLGVVKSGESDGSASYIGGFNHEAVYSIILVAAFFVASVAPKLPLWLRGLLLAYCIFGLFVANYRTSILALIPIVAGYVAFAFPNEFRSGQRAYPWMMILVGGMIAAFAVGDYASTRMADLQILASSEMPLIRSPDEFTESEGDLFSGRWRLWNLYIDNYRQGSDLQLLFGFGPDAWESFSEIYAHNTVVSYLYEFGILGAIAVVLFWAHMIFLCTQVRSPSFRRQLIFVHAGFIVLNFATMPMWAIEGLILYGLICGATLAASDPRPKDARAKPLPRQAGSRPTTGSFHVPSPSRR